MVGEGDPRGRWACGEWTLCQLPVLPISVRLGEWEAAPCRARDRSEDDHLRKQNSAYGSDLGSPAGSWDWSTDALALVVKETLARVRDQPALMGLLMEGTRGRVGEGGGGGRGESAHGVWGFHSARHRLKGGRL